MEILQLLIYGVVLGSIIALGAIGVSLTFGILGFANFGHGDLMTVGAYTGFTIYSLWSLPPWLAYPSAFLGAAMVALLVDRAIYRPLRARRSIVLLMASFGTALVIRSAVQIVWGPQTQLYERGIEMAHRIGGLRIQPDHIVIVGGAILLVIGLHLFLQRTTLGKAMRAMADNPTLARLCGIDTERVIRWTWLIGGGLAGMAGLFLAMDTRLQPDMGWFALLPIFAAAILGGIGRPYGAIIGGYVIGIAQELSTLVIATEYKPAVAFAIVVVMLILRPQGLLAGRSS